MTAGLLFNGRRQAPDLSRSRALQYGDGVFRTCFINDFHIIDIEGHIGKLLGDARALGLDPPAKTVLRREARRLAATRRRAVLKILLLRTGHGRGYAAATAGTDRLMLLFDAPAYPAAHWQRGIRAARSPIRLGNQPHLAGVKHLNRLEQVLAASATARGISEVLVSDAQGGPVSGARSNLFWLRRGTLFTPRLDRCGVAGLMRERILRLARREGIRTRQVRGSWAHLLRADEMFVCNSLIGIWPVRRLERWSRPAPGAITQRLMEALAHPRLERG